MRHTLVENIGKVVLFGIALIAPVSCKDFLQEQAPSNLPPDIFYTIPDHAEAALALVYDNPGVPNTFGVYPPRRSR